MGTLKIVIDVILALIIAFLVFLGVKRGLVKSFFKSTKIFFVILITILIGSFLAGACKVAFIDDAFDGVIADGMVEYAEKLEGKFDANSLEESIPTFVQNIVSMEEIRAYSETLSGDNTEVARAVGEKIENSVINIVANVTGYVMAFVISFIFCTIAIKIIEKFWELPTLGWINHLSGILWGVANSYIVTSFLVCIVALAFGSEFIDKTALAKLIYKIGLFTF